MERLLKEYSYYLRIERKMSTNTVQAYCSDVRDFLGQSGAPASQTGPEKIIEYFGTRSGILSKRSQARALSSLRSFFGWMILEGHMTANPCDKVDSPKLGKHLPEVLSVKEINDILGSVKDPGETGLRDQAILEVLYGCGLRVSELCSLKISCIYMAENFLRITGKGNKERMVPFAPLTGDALRNWLGARPRAAAPQWDDFVFLNRFGKPLSRISVFNLVKKYALAAGVTKDISPHTFRHSFATHLIENGADLRVVQEMLGHESILTTEIYTHIDSRTWQASILQHHPRRFKKT